MNGEPIRKEAAAERSPLAPSLLDIVELLEPLPALGLSKGAVGTVVEQLTDAFLVEFVDESGETLALEVIERKRLRSVPRVRRQDSKPSR